MKNKHLYLIKIISILFSISLAGCKQVTTNKSTALPQKKETKKTQPKSAEIYGTQLPFASESVYFLMTDRFVDGDMSNDQIKQGGKNHTFNRPLKGADGQRANVGYMGGDFKGILNNAQYIADMGFTAIWLSPIVDNPDEAFTGGEPIEFGGAFKDGGKTGYHGYWGDNFFKVDEHWPSADLSFQQLTHTLRAKYGIKTVLDIVLNHGSPAFSMKPVDQPKFGQIFDEKGQLVADQKNLPAEKLDANNPLQQFYNHKTEITQLSDMNENNPKVLDYFVRAYLHWIDEGADAFRIDTLKHMPHVFWKKFADRIREKHPGFFMFGESYSYDASFIAQNTFTKNGSISVLDFPGQKAISTVFENPKSNYVDIKSYLHLEDKMYNNPYELMTFYDNHDMQRMNASETGFIDANNWLFTSRGIPVIYYGSEMAFMAGTKEHAGNRNYFGLKNIEKAKKSIIQHKLSAIANLRKNTIALQKGIQVNLEFKDNHAEFYRIYEDEKIQQTALVVLNKSNTSKTFLITKLLSAGWWTNAFNGSSVKIKAGDALTVKVAAHGVSVYILNQKNRNKQLRKIATARMFQ